MRGARIGKEEGDVTIHFVPLTQNGQDYVNQLELTVIDDVSLSLSPSGIE